MEFSIDYGNNQPLNSSVNQEKLDLLSPYYKNDKISQVRINSFQLEFKKLLNENVEVALYFRDLNNGPWFTYNPLKIFDGGSLLKVPTMITYLKAAENYPDILNEKILFEGIDTTYEGYDPVFDKTLKVGKEYSVEELIKIMIQKSDNSANYVLRVVAEEKFNINPGIYDTYNFIGLVNDSDIISIEEYSGIFRILYNAEYLNGPMSNLALEILTETDYNNGLKKYIPNEIKIAHKFGIKYYEEDDVYHLHDCGIIYSNYPYLLCVMTTGENLEQQQELIAKISKAAYEIFK